VDTDQRGVEFGPPASIATSKGWRVAEFILPDDDELQAKIEAAVLPVVRRRSWMALWAMLVSQSVFLLQDLATQPRQLRGLLAIKVVQMGTVVVGLLTFRRLVPDRYVRACGVLICLVVCATVAASGVLRNDLVTTPVLFLTLLIVSGSALPWGAVPQAIVAAAVVLMAAWQASMVLDGLGPALVSPIMAVLVTAVVGSVFASHIQLDYIRGIEERKLTLLRREQYFRSLIEHVGDLIAVIGRDGTIHHVSPSVSRVLGYAPEALMRASARQFVHPQDVADLDRALKAVGRQGTAQALDLRLRHSDTTWRVIDGTIAKLPRSTPVPGFVFTARDISERKRMEDELRTAIQRAEAASHAKDTFMANISHEMRTPLNGILGMAEMALDTDVGPEARQDVERVKACAEALLAIINDLLDFSKIEAGKMSICHEPFDLRSLLGEILALFTPGAVEKKIGLHASVDSDVDETLISDPMRLRQILLNLVGNAIKFTKRGSVSLTARYAAMDRGLDGAGETALHCTVSDTGIGIDPSHHQMIFEPFEQADISMTRSHGGTGLGLSISKGLIERLGGRIWVESKLGHGADFHFIIPVARSPRRPQPIPAIPVAGSQ